MIKNLLCNFRALLMYCTYLKMLYAVPSAAAPAVDAAAEA
jgi:hypothetical protein